MAADAGVHLRGARPTFNRTFARVERDKYGLICPDTSEWLREMRRWPLERFDLMRVELMQRTSISWIMLEEKHNFDTMMGLISHAELVVTNDSAPVHIAQAFERPVVCIFGATDPVRVLYSDRASSVAADVSCIHCRRHAKDRSMECATPLCLMELSHEVVTDAVVQSWAAMSAAL
jgi:hypothetical protein